MDAGVRAAVVEASPAAVVVREGEQLGCSNHFRSPSQQAFNRRNPGSYRRLPALEKFAREQLAADRLFKVAEMSQASERIHAVPCAIGNGQEGRQGLLI